MSISLRIDLLDQRLKLDLKKAERDFLSSAVNGELFSQVPERISHLFESGQWNGFKLLPEIFSFLKNDETLFLNHFSTLFDLVESNKSYSILTSEQTDRLETVLNSKTPLTHIFSDDIYLSLIALSQLTKSKDLKLVEIKSSHDLFETTDWNRLYQAAILWNLVFVYVSESQLLPRSFFNRFKDIPVFILANDSTANIGSKIARPYHEFKINSSDQTRSARLWFHELKRVRLNINQAEESQLVSLFPYNLSTIEAVVDEVNSDFNSVLQSARRRSAQALELYAKRIKPSYTFSDLVLPADKKLRLQEIANFIRSREIVEHKWGLSSKHTRGHGVTILFEGASGTGKTMAAEVLANAVGLDLFQVDLSLISSKYVGETEKNLSKIFQAARQAAGILLFDEGESLFSKRSTENKSSQDRYANQEVNFLLQELESYEGIVIISSNLAQSIDQAFLRRITFELSFPRPDAESRKNLWNILLSGLPLSNDIDLNFLSSLPFAGGFIRNVIRQAASHAAIDNSSIRMKDILRGVKREYQKSDMPIEREDFGEKYWRYVSLDWEAADASQRIRKELSL